MEQTISEQGEMSRQQLLTIEELAGLLQVPKSWIYDRTRQSKTNGFPTIRVGKYLRFNYQGVLEWLQNQ
ncbi:MAG: helix-turn-helix domain-containing protein [Deltaproteobacteria bacterium]|nr:helix-turn-helix domain-containing protein [Deltaproteobacteria bacterium]MBM4322853.1 helix-turn-helix domain-containing protein [Deltaproteobacteria bacterium]MBM4347500.1 helix-turn-helix domain-containing protein [Deltaproteobacteria bacterium]